MQTQTHLFNRAGLPLTWKTSRQRSPSQPPLCQPWQSPGAGGRRQCLPGASRSQATSRAAAGTRLTLRLEPGGKHRCLGLKSKTASSGNGTGLRRRKTTTKLQHWGGKGLHEKGTRHITHQFKSMSQSCVRIFKTATRATKTSLGFTEAKRRGPPRAHRNAQEVREQNTRDTSAYVMSLKKERTVKNASDYIKCKGREANFKLPNLALSQGSGVSTSWLCRTRF